MNIVKNPEIIQDLQRIEKDSQWFAENTKSIQKKFEEEFIAIKDGKVIEDDKNFNKLLNKLKERGEDPSEIMIKFIHSKSKVILY